ncbi:MAG: hypothetical protein ACD_38C00038G0015 [uncultured bacterium]|uniref:Uncharacterized protein n=1 Tax=Candidatus Daviesbacteria bacterium GW2011_GWC2_40_12 TaxID=1618431 RepID=A0A0G0TU11_9BACT|nr:MAG: hypothetical protein ACD_38C00038G0015 [uncultured bacterium]KKQ83972.1 MAG: hypothetical protein UT04_C0022G0004 [Candidatus Daviesbacteria bacterium GW2011_GWF2_38_7]KKR15533.1 MAG: hypothetical protein UT45_C0019G0004 [Candidatus Daviesbacteria bacterium GW2011_GWA2_39_33]KKR24119.1 MAG: hypothetical protein UT54_C0029G0004 [Candidatus Daviesbacteria bacterium GW2011_GWB1_39_5]KKR41377.1 MAG: hypothetical protein UT77_C0012G0004 [Candidatus Daviesbacteria bacterium GW2011_GWC2_40_12]
MDDQQPQTAAEKPAENDAVLLLRIEEMIKTHMSQIDTLQEDITKRKDMLNDIFTNDETYQEHDKIAKEAAKVRTGTKQQIMKRPDAADLSNQLKSLKSEQKELKEGLSDYLREYQRLSGSNEIEGEDGELREIVYTAKLVKKSAQFSSR